MRHFVQYVAQSMKYCKGTREDKTLFILYLAAQISLARPSCRGAGGP